MKITRRDVLGTVLGVVALSLFGWQADAAEPGGKFVYAGNSYYNTLDPHTVYDAPSGAMRFNLYDGLYRWVDNPPQLIPWLAESHTVSAGGTVYTFKLRQDAKFHDGRPLTSADVVFSIERLIALRKGPANFFLDIVKPGTTQAPDPFTVVFNLASPSAIFLKTLPDLLIVNRELVKANEKDNDWGEAWLARNEAGSGSYILHRYDPTIGFAARRFTGHFAGWSGRPIDELEFRTILDTNTRALGMMRGDFQGTESSLPYEQIQRLRQAPNVKILEQESMRIFGLSLNNTRPPLDNVHFRRALAYAFDYDGFIKNIMKGTVARNPGPNPNTIWGTPAELKGYSYDLDKAREELKKAPGPLRPLNITALAGFSDSEQAAILFQNSLRQIGIESTVEMAPWSVAVSRMGKPETRPDIVPVWRSTFYPDPNNWVGEMFGTRYHARTYSYYSNPEFDRRLEQALVSSNLEERQKLYEEMTQIVSDDAAGIFVYNTRWFGVYSANIEGVRFSPVNHGLDLRWASFKR